MGPVFPQLHTIYVHVWCLITHLIACELFSVELSTILIGLLVFSVELSTIFFIKNERILAMFLLLLISHYLLIRRVDDAIIAHVIYLPLDMKKRKSNKDEEKKEV